MERPPAITAFAVLFCIGAVILLFGSLMMRGPAKILILFAPVYAAAGFGLWKLLEWGRVTAIAVCGVEGAVNLLSLVSALNTNQMGMVAFHFGSLGWDALIIYSLMRPEIKQAFGQYGTSQAPTYGRPPQDYGHYQPTEERQWRPVQQPQRPPQQPQQPQRSSPPSNNAAGRVTVTSTPEGAGVDVDGDFVGDTPATLKLACGRHSITVSMSGYRAWRRDLSVLADSEVRLTARLER